LGNLFLLWRYLVLGGGSGSLRLFPRPVLPRFHALIFPAFLKVFSAVWTPIVSCYL